MPSSQFHTSRRIEFADTDMAGIVHFARFFVFMETAEHQFLNSLGATVHFEHEGRNIGWPRLEATCEYLSPARFEDQLDIHVQVARKGRKSMIYVFEFRNADKLVARGRMAVACCVLDAAGGLESIPIPESLASQLAVSASAEQPARVVTPR